MCMKYPGTVKEYVQGETYFLDGLFFAGDIMMNMICSLTGLGTSTIQNWVNRKFIKNPINKKYDKNQVARIIIMNFLRKVMMLEDIKTLLVYVNGDLIDESDDNIEDAELYKLLCEIVLENKLTIDNVEKEVELAVKSKIGKNVNSDGQKRIITVLEVLCIAYLETIFRDVFEEKLVSVRNEVKPEGNYCAHIRNSVNFSKKATDKVEPKDKEKNKIGNQAPKKRGRPKKQ